MKPIKILFLCTGNSCRSQMAEGLTRALRGDDIEAWSAGTEPKGLDPSAVDVMREIGIDISAQESKHVNDLAAISFDYVVTLCGHAHETCPLFPGRTRVVHHGFSDPPALAAGAHNRDEALVHYRRVRDEIRAFVKGLPATLDERQHDGGLYLP